MALVISTNTTTLRGGNNSSATLAQTQRDVSQLTIGLTNGSESQPEVLNSHPAATTARAAPQQPQTIDPGTSSESAASVADQTQNQILAQADVSILAQANTLPQAGMSLLG